MLSDEAMHALQAAIDSLTQHLALMELGIVLERDAKRFRAMMDAAAPGIPHGPLLSSTPRDWRDFSIGAFESGGAIAGAVSVRMLDTRGVQQLSTDVAALIGPRGSSVGAGAEPEKPIFALVEIAWSAPTWSDSGLVWVMTNLAHAITFRNFGANACLAPLPPAIARDPALLPAHGYEHALQPPQPGDEAPWFAWITLERFLAALRDLPRHEDFPIVMLDPETPIVVPAGS